MVIIFDICYLSFLILFWLSGAETEDGESAIYSAFDYESNIVQACVFSIAIIILHVAVQIFVIWLKHKYIRPYCLKKFVNYNGHISHASVL